MSRIAARYDELWATCRWLQDWWRSRLFRARFVRMQEAATLLQAAVRGMYSRNEAREIQVGAMVESERCGTPPSDSVVHG